MVEARSKAPGRSLRAFAILSVGCAASTSDVWARQAAVERLGTGGGEPQHRLESAGYGDLLAESIAHVEMIDNGALTLDAGRPCELAGWRVDGGALERVADGLRLPAGARIVQPIAAFAPLVHGLEIAVVARGSGALVVTDGGDGAFVAPIGAGEHVWTGAEIARGLGRELVPRLTIALRADESDLTVASVSARVAWPCPEPANLRAALRAELESIFAPWLERCLDREGPRPTSFTCHMLDAVRGERLMTASAVSHPQPLYELMLDAWAFEPDPRWEHALELYFEDLLTLGVHPTTGLPRQWDCVRDAPLDDLPLEISKALRFLIDASEKGPAKHRERSLAAAVRIGETVLARGVLPDGSIAPIYVPADASPRTDAPPLRRLDVAAELARLSKRSGDRRWLAAAERALAELEFTNHWPGTWRAIDPGFDDSFGHYGARALTMLERFPDHPVFQRVVASGWDTYAPLWRDALACGGSIAADQVRCWDMAERFARLEPDRAAVLADLVLRAALAHVKGEQYRNGAFGDVTYFEFDPKVGLAVGDLPGAPANLLWGLAIAHRETLHRAGDPVASQDEIRALFAAVLRSSIAAYKRPFGWLSTQRERQGSNPAGGELRVARGLVEMLDSL